MKRFLAILVALLLTSPGLSGCFQTGLNVGEKMPDLFFFDVSGNKIRIYDHIEPKKRLLLHFWGAACCLTYSIPTIQSVSEIHKDESFKDVHVVSVNLDYTAPKVERIASELDITHPMLIDKESSYYRAEPKLQFFFPLAMILVVDENGVIQGKLFGPQLLPSIKDLLAQAHQRMGSSS